MSLVEDVNQMIVQNPAGLIVIPGKNQIQAMFWIDVEQTQENLYSNFIGGIANQGVEKGAIKKENLLAYLEKILK